MRCSCVVAALYCSSRLSFIVAGPQGCVEVVQVLWLCMRWLPWVLNLLSNCSLISRLARLVILQCTCMYIVLKNMQCTGGVQCTIRTSSWLNYVLSVSTSVCIRQPSLSSALHDVNCSILYVTALED